MLVTFKLVKPILQRDDLPPSPDDVSFSADQVISVEQIAWTVNTLTQTRVTLKNKREFTLDHDSVEVTQAVNKALSK